MSKRSFRVMEDCEEGYYMALQSSTVKQGLASLIRSDLDLDIKSKFLNFIDISTRITARLSRRASLIFLYYITNLLEKGENIPDLETKKDSYFEHFLKIGLTCFKSVIPDEEVAYYYNQLEDYKNVEDFKDGKYLPFGIEVPMGYDMVLSYAGAQFKTNLLNHYTTHFFDSLLRACKIYATKITPKKMIYNAILNNEILEESSQESKDFIGQVR